jgi:hypothetical protein
MEHVEPLVEALGSAFYADLDELNGWMIRSASNPFNPPP